MIPSLLVANDTGCENGQLRMRMGTKAVFCVNIIIACPNQPTNGLGHMAIIAWPNGLTVFHRLADVLAVVPVQHPVSFPNPNPHKEMTDRGLARWRPTPGSAHRRRPDVLSGLTSTPQCARCEHVVPPPQSHLRRCHEPPAGLGLRGRSYHDGRAWLRVWVAHERSRARHPHPPRSAREASSTNAATCMTAT